MKWFNRAKSLVALAAAKHWGTEYIFPAAIPWPTELISESPQREKQNEIKHFILYWLKSVVQFLINFNGQKEKHQLH